MTTIKTACGWNNRSPKRVWCINIISVKKISSFYQLKISFSIIMYFLKHQRFKKIVKEFSLVHQSVTQVYLQYRKMFMKRIKRRISWLLCSDQMGSSVLRLLTMEKSIMMLISTKIYHSSNRDCNDIFIYNFICGDSYDFFKLNFMSDSFEWNYFFISQTHPNYQSYCKINN